MNKTELVLLTNRLIEYTNETNKIYDRARENQAESDFFNEIKPFADEVRTVCEEWEAGMKQWMKEESFKYIYPQQIEQTANNLMDIAVQAFFPKTSYKRFKSHVQSVLFMLQNVKTESEKRLKQID